MTNHADVTTLLLAWSEGDQAAGSRLIEAVYDELRQLARRHLRGERDHSVAPTALVHETYLKLVDQRRVRWQNRAHFFGIAAQLMRRILVDHARSRAAVKRGKDRTIVLDAMDVAAPPVDIDILALDAALDKLAALDARQSKLVELRFFAGLTVDEAAETLEIAPITVKRDWAQRRRADLDCDESRVLDGAETS